MSWNFSWSTCRYFFFFSPIYEYRELGQRWRPPLSDTRNRKLIARGMGKRKGREGKEILFLLGVPYRAIVVIFFSILPNRGGESGHGRNGDGLFEWEMPPSLLFRFPLASESRCMDHPDASSVDCSSYECSSAKKKFDPFLKRVWIFFFFLRARGRMLQISKEIGKLGRSEKLKLEEVWNIADGFIIARRWRLVVSWVKFL